MTIKWDLLQVEAAINTFPHRIFDDIKTKVLLLGITRGGRIPAEMLSNKLMFPVDFVSPNEGIESLKHAIGSAQYIIFVDDINDSGATIDYFIHLMGKAYPNKEEPMFQFWTLIKRRTTRHPEITAGVTIEAQDWVEFPWDKDEPHKRTNDPFKR